MNRAERRREAREQAKGYSQTAPRVSPEVSGMISKAIHKTLVEKREIQDKAILAATGPMIKSVYAAIIILMTEEYGFDQEQCYDLLTKLEDKTVYCLDHQDLLDEAFEKTGIRINFREGVGRIEEVTT